MEDLFPYMSAKTKAQIESTPAAERPQMFGMIKMMGALTNVKVTKETRAGAWTLGGESWTSTS